MHFTTMVCLRFECAIMNLIIDIDILIQNNILSITVNSYYMNFVIDMDGPVIIILP